MMQISRVVYFRAALFLLFTAVASNGLRAQTIVPLKNYVRELKTVQVFVQGKPYNFLFDTGGGETFITPEIAAMLNRPVYGRNTGFRMRGEKIEFQRCDNVTLNISGTELHLAQVAVWNIMSLLPQDFPKLDGIISLHTFSRNKLTLDLPDNRLIVETEKSFQRKIKSMTPVTAVFSSGLQGREINLFIDIPINDKIFRFLFDTGSIGKTILAPSTATELGLKSEAEAKERALGRIKLKVGRKLIGTEAYVQDILYDGVLDFSFISQSVYTIDLPNRKMWIQ